MSEQLSRSTGQILDSKGNSYIKNDEDIIMEFNDKFQLMWSQRTQFETDWAICDQQVEAPTLVDQYGNARINVPIEKSMIEFYIGRQAGRLMYNVEPDGQANVQELQSAKYALDHFMDDDQQPFQCWNEIRKWDYDAAKYGTGVMYTGLTQTIDATYDFDDTCESFYDPKYTESILERWTFTPRNIPIRNFWIDYMALWQSDFSKARFCVMQETISKDEITQRRGKNKSFKNVNDIHPMQNIWPEYNHTTIRQEYIIVHHRYNRVTKDYWIVANRNTVLYKGKLLYRHNKLPFVVRQFFPKTNCIYGEGYPYRLRTQKAYKNTVMQAMLDKINMSSGMNIGIGNNGQVDGELYTSRGEINIWSFTGSMDQVKPFQIDGNITSEANLLTIIDDMIIQDSGENIKAPYSSPTGTLGEAEIMEENKQVRQKAVDQCRDLALDDALTQTLKNIAQFAPALLRTEIKENGKVIKTIYPMIKIANTKIIKKKGQTIYEEDFGNYGFFELKPDTLSGQITVRITTNSSRSTLRVIEKNSYTQYMQNLMLMVQMNPQIVSKIDFEGLMEWMKQIYGIDDNMIASTNKSELKRKNIAKVDQMTKQLMSMGSGTENMQNTALPPTQTTNGMQGMGTPQPTEGATSAGGPTKQLF